MDRDTLSIEVEAHCRECGPPKTAREVNAAVTAVAARLALRDPAQWRQLRELLGLAALATTTRGAPCRR